LPRADSHEIVFAMIDPSIRFAAFVWASWAIVAISARVVRGRLFSYFAGIVLGVHSLSVVGLFSGKTALEPYVIVAQTLTTLHFLHLLKPEMRSAAFRALVSWPASAFVAGSWLAIPWSIARAVHHPLPYEAIPFALAILGLVQSLFAREEVVDLVIGDGPTQHAVPKRHREAATRVERPLMIVQITDPHLGPFMSVGALSRICVRAVERAPDLVLLTGDYLTMESQHDERYLTEALAPLRAIEGRVFACHGNHDHEAPVIVRRALEANGVRLLVDEEAVVETPAGKVQLVGADYAFRDRAARIESLAARFPRREDHARIWLLHHPGHFRDIPEGDADLVLSGHTHGGHVGLLSLGLRGTAVSLFSDIPDHGSWARGRDRLYVHRGTCHYGFPVRLGVPSERSLLRVHMVRSTT